MTFTSCITLLLVTILSTNSITLTHECKVNRSYNFLCNGDFEQPKVTSGWYKMTNKIPCWTSSANQFEVQRNQKLNSGQNIDLNTAQSGIKYSQTFDFKILGFYQLELDYTANPYRADPKKSAFAVYFNGQLVADVIPKDKENHKLSERVRGNLGKNTIQLVDKSQNADAGAYVDNVALYEIIV